jgi:hypothetical protein
MDSWLVSSISSGVLAGDQLFDGALGEAWLDCLPLRPDVYAGVASWPAIAPKVTLGSMPGMARKNDELMMSNDSLPHKEPSLLAAPTNSF